MSNFIEVHGEITKTPYLISTRNIMFIHESNHGTMIDCGSNNWLCVEESYKQVREMIMEAKDE